MSTGRLPWLLDGGPVRRRIARALLAFYVLAGIVLPAAHAQAAAGHAPTTHVETPTTPCSAHDELNCPVWRASTSVPPVGAATAPLVVPAVDTHVAPAHPLIVTRSAVHSPLGARAPPLSR